MAFTFMLALSLGKTVAEIGQMSEAEFQKWQVFAQYRAWQRGMAHDEGKVLLDTI